MFLEDQQTNIDESTINAEGQKTAPTVNTKSLFLISVDQEVESIIAEGQETAPTVNTKSLSKAQHSKIDKINKKDKLANALRENIKRRFNARNDS